MCILKVKYTELNFLTLQQFRLPNRAFPAHDKNYVTESFAHASAILVHMSIVW